jgi:hypothetical protein
MSGLPGASNVEPVGLIAAIGGVIAGFFGFFVAMAKLIAIAMALGTGFGIPIVLLAYWLHRKKSK